MSAHDAHHDDPWSHVPPPSPWPFLLGMSIVVAFFGTLYVMGLFDWAPANLATEGWSDDKGFIEVTMNKVWAGLGFFAWPMFWGGIVLVLLTMMGWCSQIIKEKPIAHDLVQQQKDLKLFTLMFFISETLAFGAIFGYYYIRSYAVTGGMIRPEEIHLGGTLVAVATILLITSSVTCELAHKAIEHGNKQRARILLAVTVTLGLIFLYFQGYEYGELIVKGFWPGKYDSEEVNAFASLFYISTGFHGVHVAMGVIMLALVWLRLELGHFTKERHYSAVAASWYWHFVDVVWILLFISIYVMVDVH